VKVSRYVGLCVCVCVWQWGSYLEGLKVGRSVIVHVEKVEMLKWTECAYIVLHCLCLIETHVEAVEWLEQHTTANAWGGKCRAY
jgi:hypothetical protein